MTYSVSLSKQDWSLHRKGPIDQARHNQKVREAIKRNLADIVSEEAIITADGNKIVKIPIRSLDLPHFRFDPRRGLQAGQGSGDSKVGDVIGGGAPTGRGPGKGPGAGELPGIDYYEAEITIDELAALVFEDLGLPNLEDKGKAEVVSPDVRFNEIRKHGPMSNLDKRRTLLENLRRNARDGHAVVGGVQNDDLRFKTWVEDVRQETNAVVIAMRDVSGSMGEFESTSRAASTSGWSVSFARSTTTFRSSSSPTIPRPRRSTKTPSSTSASRAARRCRRPTSWPSTS